MENYEDLIGKKFTCEGEEGGVYVYKGLNERGSHYFKQISGLQAYFKNSEGFIGFALGFPPSFKLIEDVIK